MKYFIYYTIIVYQNQVIKIMGGFMEFRFPDRYEIIKECAGDDISLTFTEANGELNVHISAKKSGISYVKLYWDHPTEDVKLHGGAFERSYGDLGWYKKEQTHPTFYWYLAISNGSDAECDTSARLTESIGVKTGTNSIVTLDYANGTISMTLDLRCGAAPVFLEGRVLTAATVVFGEYRGIYAFDALSDFFSKLSDKPLLPKHAVYGSNNWYYAYGKSSHDEILEDTKFVKRMCKECDNPPYMVIDDGWQPNSCDAPWDKGNKDFPDMKALADEMRALGVRPGIWIRFLINGKNNEERKMTDIPEEMYLERCKNVLDPSHPKTLKYVEECAKRLTSEWGYELIKHDFSTFDIFGKWGFEMNDGITSGEWSFYDKSKTSAEIIKNLYSAILNSSNEAVIIGCNCIGHLCAGLHHLNRTGDDTSGKEWERTRKYGVNTLAFCLAQNRSYYMTDADCVGIMGCIEWEKNKKWLRLLAKSASPLFVSAMPGILSEKEEEELAYYFTVGSTQSDRMRPVDWMESLIPAKYEINGKIEIFDWE